MQPQPPADVARPTGGWTDTEARVRLCRGAGGQVRVEGVLCCAPVWFRWDGATLWLVGSGASPVGDDHIRVRVDVGPGVEVAVRSVAATVVYAARGAGTRWDTDIHVADGARLRWQPEPVILTRHARHEVNTSVHAADDATLVLDEVLVLGRAGETAGDLRSTLAMHRDGQSVLRTSVDTSLPAWRGPAGIDGAAVVASRLHVDQHAVTDALPSLRRATRLEPAPGCRLVVATADDVTDARRALDMLSPT